MFRKKNYIYIAFLKKKISQSNSLESNRTHKNPRYSFATRNQTHQFKETAFRNNQIQSSNYTNESNHTHRNPRFRFGTINQAHQFKITNLRNSLLENNQNTSARQSNSRFPSTVIQEHHINKTKKDRWIFAKCSNAEIKNRIPHIAFCNRVQHLQHPKWTTSQRLTRTNTDTKPQIKFTTNSQTPQFKRKEKMFFFSKTTFREQPKHAEKTKKNRNFKQEFENPENTIQKT